MGLSGEPRGEVLTERELEAHHEACHGWALGCCRWNREEAQDVLQSVYVKVLEGSARFDGRSSARTWLFAVIRRTAAERRRRQWLFELTPGRWLAREPDPPSPPQPDALAEASETSATLRAALSRLSGRQREVMHLVFYEDLSIGEAAAVLGIGVGSARTHYERGKGRLRELLEARRP